MYFEYQELGYKISKHRVLLQLFPTYIICGQMQLMFPKNLNTNIYLCASNKSVENDVLLSDLRD